MFRTVSAKLFILFFVSIFTSVLLVGLISYSKSQSIIENNMENASRQTVQEASGKLELVLKQFDELSLQFSTNKTMQNTMDSMFRETDPAAKMLAKTNIQEAINQIARTNNAIQAISLLDTTNDSQTVSSVSSGLIEIDRTSAWFAEVLGKKGGVLWLPVQENGYTGTATGQLFALTRMVNKFLLVMEIDSALLLDNLSSIQFSESSRILIQDKDGKVMLSSEASQQGQILDTARLASSHLIVSAPIAKTSWSLTGIAPFSELVKDAQAIRDLTLIMCGVAALLAIGIGYAMVRHIGRPLLHIRNKLNEGASGDLRARASLRRKDEIGEVALSFNLMMEQMNRLIGHTGISAEKVIETSSNLLGMSRRTAGSAEEITCASGEIAQGSAQLAAQAEQVFHLVDSITADLHNVVSSTDEIASSSTDVKTASSDGLSRMEQLVSTTHSSERMIDQLVGRVGQLEESTSAVQQIMTMLQNITKDSKMLSLNASIEASRGGQQSGGFKIIAQEMGRLSDQTRGSLGTVSEMTEAIQSEIQGTVRLMRDALPQLQAQIDSVRSAHAIFASVHEKSENFAAHVDMIKQYVRELEVKQKGVHTAIGNVSTYAEQASASLQQMTALSESQRQASQDVVGIAKALEELAAGLQGSLKQFRE